MMHVKNTRGSEATFGGRACQLACEFRKSGGFVLESLFQFNDALTQICSDYGLLSTVVPAIGSQHNII